MYIYRKSIYQTKKETSNYHQINHFDFNKYFGFLEREVTVR